MLIFCEQTFLKNLLRFHNKDGSLCILQGRLKKLTKGRSIFTVRLKHPAWLKQQDKASRNPRNPNLIPMPLTCLLPLGGGGGGGLAAGYVYAYRYYILEDPRLRLSY